MAMTVVTDLARLVVPVECAGCGEWDVPLCQECHAAWWEPVIRVESAAPRLDIDGRVPLPVWAVAELEGAVHDMVAAWKDGGRRDLDSVMCEAMARMGSHIAEAVRTVPGPIAVVPAPSRPASVRSRGVDLPRILAAAVTASLDRAGVPSSLQPVLTIGRGESRGSGVRQRWRSTGQSLQVHGGAPRGPVLLVDDVVTTGATLAAGVAALERMGVAVIGAAVLTSSTSFRIRGRLPVGWDHDEAPSTTFEPGR